MLSTSFCSKHTENSGPTANIQYSLPFKEVAIVYYGVPVGACPDRVFQHFFVDAYEAIYFRCKEMKRSREVQILTEMRVRVGIAERGG